MSKLTQIKRVESILKKDGFVSRNALLDIQYHKITRLSDIILKLRAQDLDIITEEKEQDTLYHLKPKRVETYRIPETGEIYTKNIW